MWRYELSTLIAVSTTPYGVKNVKHGVSSLNGGERFSFIEVIDMIFNYIHKILDILYEILHNKIKNDVWI